MRASNVRNRGFTLLELLVVIALIAIISAIGAIAYFKIRNAQQATATDQLLLKINTAFDRQWTAARDQADTEFKTGNLPGNNNIDTLITFAGGDRDRARSLWIYLRLKNEFPQNFYEAKNDTVLQDASNTDVVRLKPKKTFTANAAVAGNGAAVPATAEEAAAQSAALLYIIVTEKGARGEAFGDEATGAGQNTVSVSGTTYATKSFTDTWGTSIGFVRFATNAEIQGAPYVKTGATNKDPMDPLGKLKATWGPGRAKAYSWLFRGTGTATPAAPDNNAAAVFTQAFNTNWLPTAVSAGPDKTFDAATWLTPNATTGLIDVAYNTDDLLGYRVKREGSKGE